MTRTTRWIWSVGKLSGVLLEACSRPGTTSHVRHRPSRPDAVRWLSVCCRAARWLDHGLDPAVVRVQLRTAVQDRDRPPAPDVAKAVLGDRQRTGLTPTAVSDVDIAVCGYVSVVGLRHLGRASRNRQCVAEIVATHTP